MIEELPETEIKDETAHGLAEIDVAEAMLNPIMQQEMATKTEADEESSELSEHSDSEFIGLN